MFYDHLKRRLRDGVIKFEEGKGPFPKQKKYLIPASQLAIPQRKLFGPQRSPVKEEKSDENEVTVELNDDTREILLAEARHLRQLFDVMAARLNVVEKLLAADNSTL